MCIIYIFLLILPFLILLHAAHTSIQLEAEIYRRRGGKWCLNIYIRIQGSATPKRRRKIVQDFLLQCPCATVVLYTVQQLKRYVCVCTDVFWTGIGQQPSTSKEVCMWLFDCPVISTTAAALFPPGRQQSDTSKDGKHNQMFKSIHSRIVAIRFYYKYRVCIVYMHLEEEKLFNSKR